MTRAFVRRFAGMCAFVALAAASSSGASAGRSIPVPPDSHEIVHNYFSMADVTSPIWRPKYPIGVPPPAFSAEDLMPYTRPGDSAVVGRPFVGLRDRTMQCGDHDYVVLFPLTEYTSWYELWFLHLMGDPKATELTLNTLAYNPKGPSLLNYLSNPTAVRITNCVGGSFRFASVPTGKYQLFAFVAYDSGPYDWLNGESHGYLVPGAYITEGSTWVVSNDHLKNDGFIVTAGPFMVTKNETVRVENVGWSTTHHYRVDPLRTRLSEDGYRRMHANDR